MTKPNIQKEIKKQGNLISGFGAFLSLGAATVTFMNMPVINTVMLCGAMTPFLIDIVSLKLLIEKPQTVHHSISFLDRPFKKRVTKWIKDYIADSDNLTEKKYKVGMLSLWMRHEEIAVEKVMNPGVFKGLSEELFNNKEITKEFPLQYLFGEHKNVIKDIYGIEPTVKALLEEDKYNTEKIEIAKEVYKEYSKLGMAGKAFLNRNCFEELLILQDYKFTTEDYDLIENFVDDFKKNNKQYSTNTIHYLTNWGEVSIFLDKIIDEETNISHLGKLWKYCSEILSDSNLKHYAQIVEKKIYYLQLDTLLDVRETDQKIKTNKIKI